MRPILLAAALTGLLACTAVDTAGAAGPPPGFFGVMVDGVLDDRAVNLDVQAQAMRASGVRSWRAEFAWDQIEPEPGDFRWAVTDRKVLAAANVQIDVLGLAVRAPAWANGGSANPFAPPRDPQRFATFLKALIGRYGPKGSLWSEFPTVKPRPVRTWEVWNEPNLSDFFATQPFARPYAAMVRAAYPAIKAADPGASVLLASMANDSWRALAKLLAVPGPRLRFDAAGTHPFSQRALNVLKIVRLNRQVLDHKGYAKTPLWLTEVTWSSSKEFKLPVTHTWETTEAGQAARLTELYGLLLRNRRKLNLARVFWYTWATIDSTTSNGFVSTNSFDYSGLSQWMPDGSFRAKPALTAFRRVAKAR